MTLFTYITLIFGSFFSTTTAKTIYIQDTPISYTQSIKPIINQYCLSCHAGKRPKAKLDLSTYENLKKAIENKKLIERINNKKKPMPKGGLMPLEKRKLIESWVKEGFKE